MSVAVLGGGPASASAAAVLAEGGADVTLFRPAHRGEKPCGGAVPGWFREQLVPRVAARSVSVDAIRLENAAGSVLELDAGGLEIYRRGDLDPALVDRARELGARVVESKGIRLETGEDAISVVTDAGPQTFGLLVGGDGARGLSHRTVGVSHAAESFGLGASLDGDEGDVLVLSFPDAADAYLWIFPRPGGVSVGVAYDSHRLSHGAARAVLGRFLDRHLDGGSRRFDAANRYRYPIPLFSPSTRAAARHGVDQRILLVGDAVGVADPLTREGIRYAALSGAWAAECIVAGESGRYASTLTERLSSEMKRAGRAARLFFEDGLAQWMVPVCRVHPAIRRVLSDLLSCRQPYTSLRRRLLRAAVGIPGTNPAKLHASMRA
ncbi:MAG: NAD(P)/FAD-dependent oxidoreductase [Acidobacteriota bacterium]|nr:NAD(P)/FAD-dependent oxidoreductase [Acidobacteriota bacterium]